MPKKLRAQQITIDLSTETAPVWTHVTLQRCIKNEAGVTTQTIDSVDHIYKSLHSFGNHTVTACDPVTQAPLTVSGYGVASLIKSMVTQWILEKHPGVVTPDGDLIEQE